MYTLVPISSMFPLISRRPSGAENKTDILAWRIDRYLNSKGIIPPASVFKKGENSEKTRGGNNATAVDMALDVSPPSDDDDTPMKGDAKELEG